MNSIIWQLESNEYLTDQLITYIGNKRKLLGFIEESLFEIMDRIDKDELTILDGFAGSGVVSRMFKRHCSILYSNDLEPYARLTGQCYLANRCDFAMPEVRDAIADLNHRKLRSDLPSGIIADLYAPKDDANIAPRERVFYTRQNATIIDNIRRTIEDYPTTLRPFILAPLLHKASVHANTSGVFKGFYKNSTTNCGQFGGNAANCLDRITKEIELPVPIFSNFECEWHMHQRDVNELVKELHVDVAYFDPPYNQHPYGSNYFMLNVIESYARPVGISTVSGIPENWNKSSYNKKEQARKSFNDLVRDTNACFIIISYNDEGLLPLAELETIFAKYGTVNIRRKNYNTFRGSRNLAQRSKTVDEVLFIIEKTK